MSVRLLLRCTVLAFAGLLATSLAVGAQSPGTSTSSTSATTTVADPVVREAKIPIPGKALTAFDIGWVDPVIGKYYLADRSNASIDIVGVDSEQFLGQIGGFVGNTGKSDTSGPDGIVVTFSGKELWAGDGDSSLKVVDLTANKVVASISTGGKMRADELAYDPKDNLILIANDADDPPFLSFISVGSRQVLKKVPFPDSTGGLEQPVYDPNTGMFYQSVPSTNAHPGGEIAVLSPSSMSVSATYPLTDCGPTGLVAGPGNQLFVVCGDNPDQSLILDRTTGKTLATVATGGGDEGWYNPGDNRYYEAESGVLQTLGVVDAGTMSLVENVETGVGTHSVAADDVTNRMFVPISAPDPACPHGCIAVFADSQMEGKGQTALRPTAAQ